MQISARAVALETLVRCRRDGAWSGASIDNAIKKYELVRREAALASRLCLGVLQNRMLCDFYIDCFCRTKLEPKVRDIIRLGVYQILFLDRIPVRAAVSESVALCRDNGCERAAGLVNAVLRRIADNRSRLPEIPGKGTAEYLSVRYSHPLWLCEYLLSLKGYEYAESFLAANNEPPPLTVQVNTLKVSVEDYVRSLERAELPFKAKEPYGCIELESGAAPELNGFDDGLFYVQDRAARLAVEIAAPKAGMSVLDTCAAPGGKSFAAAIRMENKGKILSCDIHEKKLGLVSRGAERLGIDIIETKAADARHLIPELAGRFDVVIADVPCSGLGVIRKKPEIRYKNRTELSSLPEIQIDILNNVSAYVANGGVLMYSTCTVMREENEAVVEAFLDRHKDFSAESFDINGIYAPEGVYTFWPNTDETDGFFAAKLRKKL